jgi:hypothetical protein
MGLVCFGVSEELASISKAQRSQLAGEDESKGGEIGSLCLGPFSPRVAWHRLLATMNRYGIHA